MPEGSSRSSGGNSPWLGYWWSYTIDATTRAAPGASRIYRSMEMSAMVWPCQPLPRFQDYNEIRSTAKLDNNINNYEYKLGSAAVWIYIITFTITSSRFYSILLRSWLCTQGRGHDNIWPAGGDNSKASSGRCASQNAWRHYPQTRQQQDLEFLLF